MSFVYRMYVGEEIKYIGYTTDLRTRMGVHFTLKNEYNNHTIVWEQAKQVTKIDYTETGTANGRVLEAYLIALNKPEWNKDFVEDDKLTYVLETGHIEWKEYTVPKRDNAEHHIFVWKDDVLLYEIPKVHSVYDELCKELGIEQEMEFGYSHPVYVGGYKLMRLSGKRHIKTGKQRQIAKYSFMGYPEAWDGK